MNPNIFKWLILNRYVVFLSYWHQTMFRYQVGGGHITIKRRKNDWEGGFVKRRLKFVFITGAWSLSTFLLISWRYSVWFDLFVFAMLKFVELRKDIQKRWWRGSLNWKSKQRPLNSTRKKPTREIIEGKLWDSCLTRSIFSIFNTPSALSILTVGKCYPLDKSDQITKPMDNTIGFPYT